MPTGKVGQKRLTPIRRMMSPRDKQLEHDVFGDGDAGLEDAEASWTRPRPSCMRPSTEDAAAIKPQRPAKIPVWKSGACIGGPSAGPTSFIKPGQRADRRVRRFELRIRPLAAEPAHVEMNEAGIALLDRGEIERRAIRRIDVAAIEQDVAVADQFGQARRCAGIVRVERDARLVEIEKRKPGAVPFRRQRRGAAKRIARAAVRSSARSRRNRRTGGRNSWSRPRSRSRQSADATTRPSRFLMAE